MARRGASSGERAASASPGFGARDVRFLETIAGQIAAAVGRTELYARMADLAFKDPLTGVGNRRALEERLELCARDARESGGDVAVLLGDLDNLKELNDALGHAQGDQALAAFAAALTAEAREVAPADQAVYRLGGDEFCLLLANGTAEQAHDAGERTLARLADGRPAFSASFGVASLGGGTARPPDLLRAADHALYVAKRTGRRQVCVADSSHDTVWDGFADGGTRDRRRVRARDLPSPPCCCAAHWPISTASSRFVAPFQRLQAVVANICGALDAARAAISFEAGGAGTIATYWMVNLRAGQTWSKGPGPGADLFATDDYPGDRPDPADGRQLHPPRRRP